MFDYNPIVNMITTGDIDNITNLVKDTIEAIKSNGLRKKVRVMIGGAPVTREFADEIGADGYSVEAGAAAKTAINLLA